MYKQDYKEEPTTTVKITGADLILVSKTIADIRAKKKVFSQSRIMVNSQTQEYFVYLTFRNSDLADALAEITPYGDSKP